MQFSFFIRWYSIPVCMGSSVPAPHSYLLSKLTPWNCYPGFPVLLLYLQIPVHVWPKACIVDRWPSLILRLGHSQASHLAVAHTQSDALCKRFCGRPQPRIRLTFLFCSYCPCYTLQVTGQWFITWIYLNGLLAKFLPSEHRSWSSCLSRCRYRPG